MARSILSLCLSGHGFSAAVCIDGKIVAATTLERLSRVKNDILLPISRTDLDAFGWKNDPSLYENYLDLPFDLKGDYGDVDLHNVKGWTMLIDSVLASARIGIRDVECVVYSYRHVKSARRYFSEVCPKAAFINPEHHFSHACQAYLPSGFDEAAILVVDGQGVPLKRKDNDQLSGCLAWGQGNSIKVIEEFPVRYSLGSMYASFTKKCGFKTNEECKLMGLASYGDEDVYNEFRKDVRYHSKEFHFGNIAALVKRGFRPQRHIYSLGKYWIRLGQYPDRKKDGEYSKLYKDLSRAAQHITEDVMIFLANELHRMTGSKNLCIAGGVGLNCVANYKVLENTPFENVFVHPSAGDNGLAVGQALYAHNIIDGNARTYTAHHDYLGKEYTKNDVEKAVKSYSVKPDIKFKEYGDMKLMYKDMASFIADGKITSWWQGRSEFGPRALGNRSILADPRRKDMKDILNSRVKFREAFRPFTPSVLKERASEYFTLDIESPFMLLAPYVKPGKDEIVPAITHVDNTARVQTVTRETNERYYDLIKEFDRQTGVPVVLDTSFNVAGEPIVETPEDALRCFMSTDIDLIGIDNCILRKVK